MKKKTPKLFCAQNVSKKYLRRLICNLAYEMHVNKVRFAHKGKYISGSYNADYRNIFVDGKQKKREMLLTFFHELAHHVAYFQKGKWITYHENAATPKISAQAKFMIENKVDKIARQLWNKYVSVKTWGRYRYGYPLSQKKYIVKWLDTYY
jgi:hypothetical protein